MESLQNTIAIQDYLPHRKPMLMVDLILELNDHEVKTVFELKADNLFVENGFFAESGLIENAAQTCSSIVGQTFFLDENQNVKQDVQVIGSVNILHRKFIEQFIIAAIELSWVKDDYFIIFHMLF